MVLWTVLIPLSTLGLLLPWNTWKNRRLAYTSICWSTSIFFGCLIGLITYTHDCTLLSYGDTPWDSSQSAFVIPQPQGSECSLLPPSETALVICNHLTEIDWLFVLMFLSRQRSMFNMKFIMKKEVGYIPFLGWVSQLMLYLLLTRK
uniref:1-acyl-sn-glycerol-3-phosphate acyltransferase 2 n=1 Tax=Lygus hesperus TaxID=30085 RepID=A0A0A9ZJ71_LYGHE